MGTIYNIERREKIPRISKQLWQQQGGDSLSTELPDLGLNIWQQNTSLYDGTAKRILIVDDCSAHRNLLSNFLSKFGYQTIAAGDGEAGVEKALLEKPDLIILDVIMPKMNGFEACRTIKSIQELAQIPVFLLTSKSERSDEFWGKKQGADMYLTKPFDPNKLLKAVFSCLAKHLLLRYEREEKRQQRKMIAGQRHAITA